MTHSFLPFIAFALVASISPGPTNLLILAQGARHGLRSTRVPILAACLAAAATVLLVGMGLGQWLTRHPQVQHMMMWGGVLWLSWLAWQLLRSAGDTGAAAQVRAFTAVDAATLQVINPKVWLMAVAVIGVFAAPGLAVWQLALLFLVIALPCMTLWAVLGAGSAAWLQTPRRMRLFNRALGGLLLLSAWAAVLS